MLTLAEELALLALRNTDGKRLGIRSALQCAMTGGLLLDLACQSRISVNIKNLVTVNNTNPVGNFMLDWTLQRISKSRHALPMLKWVIDLTVFKSNVVDNLIFEKCCSQGFLKQEIRPFLIVFQKNNFLPTNAKLKTEIMNRLRLVIRLSPKRELRATYLLGLMARSGLAGYLLSKEEAETASINTKAIFSPITEQRARDPVSNFYCAVLEAVTRSQQTFAAG